VERWHGVFTVMFTPFKDDESLDERALRKHIDFLIEEGHVHGIICTGIDLVHYVSPFSLSSCKSPCL
jgi:dihydrodipicolinate synthase/N-acetylneuraminate lyase